MCQRVCLKIFYVVDLLNRRARSSSPRLEAVMGRRGAGGSEVEAHIVPIWKPLFQLCSTKADHNELFVLTATDPW